MFETLAHDQIVLHYQPLASRTGTVAGFEALMRWHHQGRGPVSPEAFIPVFESNGLIVPLSRWALGQACRDAAAWPLLLTVSLNLSAVQFEDEDLPALVRNALAETGLKARQLEIEIKEATLARNPARAAAMLKELARLDVGLALDDFTAGPGATGIVGELPFSKIKIDPVLVGAIGTSLTADSVVHMIIGLAHSRGLIVAAKGVETETQRDFLIRERCDLLQGFLIGSPAPVTELEPYFTPSLQKEPPSGNPYDPTATESVGGQRHAHSRP